MELKVEGAQTIYWSLCAELDDLILCDRVREGAFFWTYEQIMKEFKVSDNTVTKAREVLIKRGILEKVRGVGTKVCVGAKGRIIHRRRGDFECVFIKQMMDEAFWLDLSFEDIKELGNRYLDRLAREEMVEAGIFVPEQLRMF